MAERLRLLGREAPINEAERFLAAMGPKARSWTFQTFDDDSERKEGRLVRVLHGTLEQHASELIAVNRRGAGVFVTVNRTDGEGRKAENIRQVRAVFADLDGAPLDPVKTCRLKPHVIIETSPDRFQVFWRVRGLAVDEFKGVQRAIAQRFDGDPAVAILTACARLPGFDHRKGDPFRVHIIEQNSMPPYAAEEIAAEFPPVAMPHRPPSSPSGVVLPKGAPLEAARAFVEHNFGGVDQGIRSHRGDFYSWTGSHYAKLKPRNLNSLVYEFLSGAQVMGKNGLEPYNPTRSKVAEVIAALEAGVNEDEGRDLPFWISPHGLDLSALDQREFVACENGLLDMETRELKPHDQHCFNLHCLPFQYQDDAPKPRRWFAFLRQLWPEDKQARMALAEVFGYMLTADTSQQKIFLLVGPKRSGKGTIGRVLTALLGRASVVNPTLAGMGGEFGLQPLINKRAAIISDARIGGRTNTSVVVERLLNISGEDAITVNRKYKDHWTGRLGVRFLLLTNELPNITDASGALASRFVIFTMQESFYGREDTGLTTKLLEELPGILNWSLRGLDRLRARGHFEMPESSKQALRHLEDLSSPVGAFLREWCEVGPAKRVNVKVLYGAWRAWCEDRGERASSDRVFGRDLRAVAAHVRPTGSGRKRSYIGVGLTEYGRRKYERASER